MTQPTGGNDINLAALWIPVMPETSHMGEEMERAGTEAKRKFEAGFNSGASPESMGSSFGSKLQQSISKELRGLELPLGTSSIFEKLNGEVDKSTEKLRGEASQALRSYSEEYEKLGQAQARATEAEQKVNAARAGGFNNASVLLPLLQEQTRAQNALGEAQTNTGTALDNYNGKLGKLKEAHQEAANSGGLMAGVMGGVVVAGVQMLSGAVDSVVEKIVEGMVEAFKTGIEVSKEFADHMIELGESYEHLGIQITEFSSLTGEQFEATEAAARAVFSSLDVAGEDTGKTMAQLSTALHTTGEEIAPLVTHVEELHGRFTDLKAVDLAHVFTDFDVDAEHADEALASLLQSSRNSGQDLGQLTTALSGMAGLTLKEAGLNIEQAGAFMGDLLKYGEPGRQVMGGMATAMKDFGKEGLSFSDGMKMAGEQLKALGDTAEGQDLAEKLFGTRNWVIAKQAVQNYLDIVQQGPDAFSANAESLDQFLEKTRTLQNEWEEVKHKAEEAFLPVGLEAVHMVSGALTSMVGFVHSHMDEIRADVKKGGDFFIQFAHDAQQFAIGVLEFFSPIVGAVQRMIAGALISMGDFANVTGQLLSVLPGPLGDVGKGMSEAGKAADGFGHDLAKVDVGKGMDDLAEWLKQHPIDVGKAQTSWDEFSDHVVSSMDSANDAVGKSSSWFGSAGAEPGSPGVGAPTGPGGNPGLPPGYGGGGGTFGDPGAQTGAGTFGAPQAGLGHTVAGNAESWRGTVEKVVATYAPVLGIENQQAWVDALVKQINTESGGNANVGKNLTDSNAQAGHPSEGLLQFIPDTFAANNISGGAYLDPEAQIAAALPYVLHKYGQNPDGSPKFIGEGHGYATGGSVDNHPGMPRGTDTVPAWLTPGEEVIPVEQAEKFRPLLKAITAGHFDVGGTPSWDQAMAAADQMAGGKTGGLDLWLQKAAVAAGVDPATWVGPMKVLVQRESSGNPLAVNGWDINAKKGTPSIGLAQVIGPTAAQYGVSPADLTDPVSNLTAAMRYIKDRYGDISKVQQANPLMPPKGYAGGGTVDDAEGVDPQIQFVDSIAKGFGLQLTAGKSGHGTHSEDGGYHDSGEAGDFSDGLQTDTEYAFAAYMIEHFGSELAEVIHTDPRLPKLIKDGKLVDAQSVYGPWLAGHKDHVHIAVKATQAMSDLSPGSESLSGGIPPMPSIGGAGSTPGGKNGAAFPGMPGQYGGYGAYGGANADQIASAAEAVQSAKDRQSDLDYQVQQNQKRVDDIKAQLAEGDKPNKVGALGLPIAKTPDEIAADDRKRKSLNDELETATHALAVSQREQSEQGGKIADAQRKQNEAYYKKPTGTGTSTQTGEGKAEQQLGSGLLKGIGEELGIGDVFGKSPLDWGITKLITGLFNYGNNLGDAMFGKTTTGTPNGSVLGGLTASIGLPTLPSLAPGLGAGPNMQVNPNGTVHGAGQGQPPGPVIQGDYMPINVSPNVDPAAVLGPVQEQRNSQNATLHGQTGGLPQ